MSAVEDSRKRNVGPRQNATPRNSSNLPQQTSRKVSRTNQPVNKLSNVNNSNATTPTTPTSTTPIPVRVRTPQDDHVSITGYNFAEVENMLKKTFDAKALQYKPDQNAHSPGASGIKAPAWGIKSPMANGKDFWLELRKQVTTLQKGEGMNKGG